MWICYDTGSPGEINTFYTQLFTLFTLMVVVTNNKKCVWPALIFPLFKFDPFRQEGLFSRFRLRSLKSRDPELNFFLHFYIYLRISAVLITLQMQSEAPIKTLEQLWIYFNLSNKNAKWVVSFHPFSPSITIVNKIIIILSWSWSSCWCSTSPQHPAHYIIIIHYHYTLL